MATTKKLAELFRALAASDTRSAEGIAAQICTIEEQKGHHSAARLLRGSLHANGSAAKRNDRPFGGDPQNSAGIISTALTLLPSNVKLRDVVLSSKARTELEGLLVEWKHRDRLHRKNLAPRSKLLFYGPPGCGKSLTARALAHELAIPIYVVRFDAVIGAYLGQTAIHLRQLFHFAETTPCVLLLDELDALGKRRGNPLDVGELDRIVISLMQELEHSKPQGFVVGTSNLPRHLDDALWRRFDLSLQFKTPSVSALKAFIMSKASLRRMTIASSVVREATQARSFAAAESVLLTEARRQALASE